MKFDSTDNSSSISQSQMTSSGDSIAGSAAATALFCEQVGTVTNLFDKWNDCERTVVMYALLKRLRYPSLKFLQHAIDNNLTQNLDSQANLSYIVVDINANNPSYLQNLLNAYKTFHAGDFAEAASSASSSDKDFMSAMGSDFQQTLCDQRKVYGKKEDILSEVLNMLPLLKPGNEEAKAIYLSLIPIAVNDTMRHIVPTELVQQIFSYLLIHPAISGEDRKSLNVWLRHLEERIQSPPSSSNMRRQHQCFLPIQTTTNNGFPNIDSVAMTTSGSSASSSSSSSSAASCSSASNVSVASSIGNLMMPSSASSAACAIRSTDWQTIAPPSKMFQQQPPKSLSEWSNMVGAKPGPGRAPITGSVIADQFCDNFNGITLNELASSQNSLGLSLGAALMDQRAQSSALVNGVVAGANATAASNLFGSNTNPIINIINNNNSSNSNLNSDDHDTSFSKNGTEILDFEPNQAMNSCDSCVSGNNLGQPQRLGYASILMGNSDPLEINRWSLDSKLAALKTRRSNSLTTQTISSSSSSNSSVITVNDNCSNSTENLAQFANKQRSFSLSIEHPRGVLTNSGSDTRLDEYKPNYIKFQTRNIGMSNIGLWLKSLRLHKYIEVFKNMTYEDMLQISEDYLQSLGVTKGASHKLALCIEKLKERAHVLAKMEQDLLSGQVKLHPVLEELTNIVLTPMKPVETVNATSNEDNVAFMFLKLVDLAAAIVHKDYTAQDEENISVIMWLLDRSIHNEAFVSHGAQLKELKFKMSKLKMSLGPKGHHLKNGSNSNLNKPRWNPKTGRKCDPKNGSNDRINLRKNSGDGLSFGLGALQQYHSSQQQQQQPHSEYDKYHAPQQHQYKSSSYPNFVSNQQQQQQQHHQQNLKQHQQIHHQHQQMQQQMQQQMLQHNAHFPALAPQQHRRSLNNLIVVAGGAQQAQPMVYKPGHGMVSASESLQMEAANYTPNVVTNATNSDLAADQQQQQQQQQQQHQHQQQQPAKKTMAAVVLVSKNDMAAAVASNIVSTQPPTQLLINNNNNNSNMLNNNLLCQQQQQQHLQQQLQQQQLQLLAAAAAAVGSSCSGNNSLVSCVCSNNNNNNNKSSQSSCSNCSNMPPTPNRYDKQDMPPMIAAAQLSMAAINAISDKYAAPGANASNTASDIKSLEQLETLCLQMTEQAIN